MKPDLEMEIKVLEINKSELELALLAVEATKKYETTMMIISYDFFVAPNTANVSQDIKEVVLAAYEFYRVKGSLRSNNAHLRLRTFTHTNKIEFTFKHNIDETDEGELKRAHEYNAYLSEDEAEYLKKHVRQLGMKEVAVHEKHRASWRLSDGCICDIDTYPGIPTFVELEGSEAQINRAVGLLKLTDYSKTQDSGAHFFAGYNQEFYSKLLF